MHYSMVREVFFNELGQEPEDIFADFVIDFAHLLPSHKKTLIRARVVMSPLSAKMLVRALNENIARYEAAFGEIKVPQQSLADQLFRPPQPPEPPSENE